MLRFLAMEYVFQTTDQRANNDHAAVYLLVYSVNFTFISIKNYSRDHLVNVQLSGLWKS